MFKLTRYGQIVLLCDVSKYMKFHQCVKFFFFSILFTMFGIFRLYIFFLAVEMVSHWFNLYYFDNYWGWIYFHMCTGHWISSSVKCLFKYFAHFHIVLFFLQICRKSLYILDLYLLTALCFVNPVCGFFFFKPVYGTFLYIEVLHFHVVKPIHLFIYSLFVCVQTQEARVCLST